MYRCIGQVFLAVLLLGCGLSAWAGGTPADVDLPDVRGFEREGTVVRPNPATGLQARYRSRTHEELTTDVFIFVGGEFADEDAAVARYLRGMRDEMREAQKAGIYELVDFLEDGRRSYPSRGCGRTTGAWLRMRTSKRGGSTAMSHAHLFYAPPFTVKFRSSFPAKGNRSFDDEIERLVGEFMRQLEWPGATQAPCRRGLVAP